MHAHTKRINPKGIEGVFRCVDCGKEMSMRETVSTDCPALDPTPFEVALIDAIDGE